MKKLLIFMLVLGMASLANATFLDVVTDGVGDLGNAGTLADPLEIGEDIKIKIVLNYYDSAAAPSYDGYCLSIMDVDLTVSGPGTLSHTNTVSGNIKKQSRHTALSPWYDDTVKTTGVYMSASDGVYGIYPGPQNIVWDFVITCTGAGTVTVDLSLGPLVTQYSLQGYPATWVNAVEADFGDLTIHQVPEPTTVALLGLGGLFLLRRRK